MLPVFAKAGQRPRIYHLRHTVKVDEQGEENFISRRAVFVYAAEVAGNSDTRNVFAVESEYALRLLT